MSSARVIWLKISTRLPWACEKEKISGNERLRQRARDNMDNSCRCLLRNNPKFLVVSRWKLVGIFRSVIFTKTGIFRNTAGPQHARMEVLKQCQPTVAS